MNRLADFTGAKGVMPRGLLIAGLLLVALCGMAFAQPGQGRMYGKGNPFTVEDLPDGPLKSDLLRLPPQAYERAMHHFEDFSFPAEDARHLRVDEQGGVFYEDPSHPLNGEGPDNGSVDDGSPTLENGLMAIDPTLAFSLHSKPGASRTVYLNMAGHVVTGTVWNSSSGVDPLYMLPYSQDSNYDNFTQAELNAIAEVWKRVAEDFAPYDIDVTTEKPASFGPQVGHILVTRKTDANGSLIYNCSCGGVAYVNVWGGGNYPYYQPALVFTDGVGSGPHNIAEAASHELGHNLSLSHDGTASTGYYSGHGSGFTDWAPIMGVGYSGQVTQWSKGEYSGANNTQDDLLLMANRLTYRNDDHENSSFLKATPLVVTNSTQVVSTTPVSDPANQMTANKGIIQGRDDVDLFYVDVQAGTIDLKVEPVWRDYLVNQSYRGANLDIRARLYNASGTLLAESNLINDTFAQVTAGVAPGRYILAIDGVGYGTPPDTGYSDYASLGQYFISGTVPAADTDELAPTPNPMSWAVQPATLSSTAIAMTATTATDDRSSVQYRFDCVSGGTGCGSSAWQSSPAYTATGLAPGTSYTFQVRARDLAGNETLPSTDASAMTGPPNQAPTAGFTFTASALTVSFSDTSSDPDGSVASWAWNFGDGTSSTQRNPSHTFANDGTYNVNLTVTDNEGATASTTQSVAVQARRIHVATLDNASTAESRSWTAAVVIAVHEADHATVAAGATVSGVWSDGTTGTASCTTDAAGECTVSKANLKTRVARVTFTVTGVSRSGSIATANDVSDITVAPVAGNQAPVANFTWTTALLSVTFHDASSDSDGSLAAWQWNFGDGQTSSQQNPSHAYAGSGSYNVTLTVTDNQGATASRSQVVTVADTLSFHHVGALNGTAASVRKGWSAEVTVSVHDGQHKPLAGATVSGIWGGGTTGSGTCTTGGNGQCSMTRSNLKTGIGSVTFNVSDVVKSGSQYDSAADEQSSIVVSAP